MRDDWGGKTGTGPTQTHRLRATCKTHRACLVSHAFSCSPTRRPTPTPTLFPLPSLQLRLHSEPFRVHVSSAQHRRVVTVQAERICHHAKKGGGNVARCQHQFPNHSSSGYPNTAAPLIQFNHLGHHSAWRGNNWLLFHPFERTADAAIIDGGMMRPNVANDPDPMIP